MLDGVRGHIPLLSSSLLLTPVGIPEYRKSRRWLSLGETEVRIEIQANNDVALGRTREMTDAKVVAADPLDRPDTWTWNQSCPEAVGRLATGYGTNSKMPEMGERQRLRPVKKRKRLRMGLIKMKDRRSNRFSKAVLLRIHGAETG